MSKLSTILLKYYKKEGGRIVFKNGMTLNQLALEMWEKLGCKEVDASVISRVLRGERMFTPRQLVVLGRILKLKRFQINQLKGASWEDLVHKSGYDFSLGYFNAREILENAENDLMMIQKLRRSHQRKLADELKGLTLAKLDKKIERVIDDDIRSELVKIKDKLLTAV